MDVKQKIEAKRQELSRDTKGKFKTKRDPFLLWGEYPHGWEMIKDAILCVMLINALIGQLQQIDIASLMANRTIVIANEAIIKPVEASAANPEPKATQEAEFGQTGEFSGYTASIAETDADPYTMASGRKVYSGAIACPNGYKFGDKIEIEGMGVYVCEDRMNVRYRDKQNFDIYFESYDEAIKFGRKQLKFAKL